METYEKQSPPLPPISLKLRWSKKATEGEGGPWKNSSVKLNEPSDPYLIGFYDKRKLQLSHSLKESENFQSRWIRFSADKDCNSTTWLKNY